MKFPSFDATTRWPKAVETSKEEVGMEGVKLQYSQN